MTSIIIVIVISIVVLVILFLLLREINCWYWKINERISLMQEQNELLRNLTTFSKTNIGYFEDTSNNKEKMEISGHKIALEHPLINPEVEPDIEKIKTDLIGQKIPGWMFSYLKEFKSSEILKTTKSENSIDYHVKFNLIDSNSSNSHDCELSLIYLYNDKGWFLNEINTLYIT